MPEEMKVRWTYLVVIAGSKDRNVIIKLGRDFPGYKAKAGTLYPDFRTRGWWYLWPTDIGDAGVRGDEIPWLTSLAVLLLSRHEKIYTVHLSWRKNHCRENHSFWYRSLYPQ
jgi:hypothetical protein